MDYLHFAQSTHNVEQFLAQFPEPSEATSRQYRRAYKRMKREKTTPLQMGVVRKNTFYFYRAAWIYGLLQEARLHVRMAVHAYGIGEQQIALRFLDKVQALRNALSECAPDPGRQRVSSGQPGAWRVAAKDGRIITQSLSKRHVLPGLPKDWRMDMWKAAIKSGKYLDAIAVLSCCGCRPAELEAGVEMKRLPEGILFAIGGAKTHGGKFGQKKRFILIGIQSPEAVHLAQQLSGQRVLTVTAKAALLKDSVANLSRKVWPRRKSNVTPYVYRHQFAADMKAGGLGTNQVAQALGHSVEETQRFYGHWRQARRGGNRVLGVKATHAVRPRRRVYRGPGGNLPKRRSP